MTSLTVLVPVYNEQHLVATSLARLEVLEASPLLERLQVIVIDDSSKDRSPEVLAAFAAERGIALAPPSPHSPRATSGALPPSAERGRGRKGKIDWLFLRHARNGGKGAAIQTGLAHADAAITIIHDADLEYHPKDIARIVQVFVEDDADAVFGSRFAGGASRRALLFRHELGNRLLTFLCNLVSNVNLTDMETCYKAVRTDLFKSIPIVSNDFRLEPELTIKLAKREARIFEVPISYSGRTYQEGKKIGLKDGFLALGAILRFWVSDRIFAKDAYGSEILGRLARAPRFNAWMADTIRPLCGQRVLEIGSGTGNLTRELVPRDRYVASDINPLYVSTLGGLRPDRPYLDVQLTDVTRRDTFPKDGRRLRHRHLPQRPRARRRRHGRAREHPLRPRPGGHALVLVPRGPGLMGTLDEVLGHRRRYTEESLRAVAAAAGFEVKALHTFNRIGTPAWWLNGKVLRRRGFGLFQNLDAQPPDAALPADRQVPPLPTAVAHRGDGAKAMKLAVIDAIRRPPLSPTGGEGQGEGAP